MTALFCYFENLAAKGEANGDNKIPLSDENHASIESCVEPEVDRFFRTKPGIREGFLVVYVGFYFSKGFFRISRILGS